MSVVELLCGAAPAAQRGAIVVRAEGADLAAHHALRRAAFVEEQGLFGRSDRDDLDDHPATVALVARDADGSVVGGVRLAPGDPDRDLAWWHGSRLVVAPGHRGTAQVGAALVRAACAEAEALGALRFEATVQASRLRFFRRLGWEALGPAELHGSPHERVRYPIERVRRLVAATKGPIAAVLGGLRPGGDGWVGDDAAPVPGSDLVAACDAILPSLVEREPWWAGWCGVLVNVNDVAVKGATPIGLLDAVGARDAAHAALVLAGLRDAAEAWGVPVLGGHTTLGVPGSLAVTVLGRTADPVPAAGGRPGHEVVLAADVAGGWRPGHAGRQWDSTTSRRPEDLRAQAGLVGRWRPSAAKDVSMAGVVGTLGMLAEASGCGAELDVAAVPSPEGAGLADWLTCFPGFGVLAAQQAGRGTHGLGSLAPVAAATCGRLVAGSGVAATWPDGARIDLVDGHVTGLGSTGGAEGATWRR